MRAILTGAFFFLAGFSATAQQNYFVYVQTDNKQPFYVKMNEKLMSSSASGYIVIPKLSTGNYNLNIGFPKDEFPMQSLTLNVAGADAGYLLKNFGEKGWGLYNIQTMAVTMSGAAATKQPAASGDDLFANTLSGAANTTLNPERPIAETKPAVIKQDPPIAVKPEKTVAAIPAVMRIEKISGSDAPEGRSMVYVDRAAGKTDTITVFIPADMKDAAANPAIITNASVTSPAGKEEKFLNIELPNPNTGAAVTNGNAAVETPVTNSAVSSAAANPKTADKPVVSFNSDCKANADDADFLKLRKKMAAEATDANMVAAAAKSLKAKCYSTEQVKNLSLLFLTDAGKYSFFDAAYPHTFDTQNFPSLQSQLKEEYYLNRFRAMVRN